MKYIIYSAKSPSNKYYIGLTSQGLKERRRKHYNRAKIGSRTKFHCALRKYKNKFIWKILDKTECYEDLKSKEQFYIKKYKAYTHGYNLTKGGEGSLGYIPSNKTLKKLSKKFKGDKNPMYGKKGILSPVFGKKQSMKARINKGLAHGSKEFLVFKKDIIIGKWLLQTKCAEDLKLNVCNINSCLNKPNRYKSHKGYTFKYVGEQNGPKI